MASTAAIGSNRRKTFMAILIPVLVLFCAFNTIPLITGFLYSFTDSKGYGAFNIVGLQNYIDMFSDTRILELLPVHVQGRHRRHARHERHLAHAGHRAVEQDQVQERAAAACTSCPASSERSSSATCSATSSPTSSRPSRRRVHPRQHRMGVGGHRHRGRVAACAQTTIIYITGLSSVPEDVYEAGALDGATGWDKFRYITFPLIMPSVTTNMVLVMKDMLMVFDQIVSMTSGGPAQSTESISYLIYNNGLSGGQFGYQCANAVIFFILIALVSILQTKFLNSKEEQL